MSYDLNFWRYSPLASFDPKEVDRQLRAEHTQGMAGDDMNLLIDVGTAFDCPLFDPQVPKRFDGT